MPLSSPSPSLRAIECHVGRRIRTARSMMGISQERMSEMLGISPRQQHLYETGQSRISVGRLDQMARVLHVDIGYFFEGLAEEENQAASSPDRLLFHLTRNFLNIRNYQYRSIVCNAAEALALLDRQQPTPPKRATALEGAVDVHKNPAEIHRKSASAS